MYGKAALGDGHNVEKLIRYDRFERPRCQIKVTTKMIWMIMTRRVIAKKNALKLNSLKPKWQCLIKVFGKKSQITLFDTTKQV